MSQVGVLMYRDPRAQALAIIWLRFSNGWATNDLLLIHLSLPGLDEGFAGPNRPM